MQVFMDKLARLFALLGGAVLAVLIVMICLSIFGRSLNSVLNSDLLQSTIPNLADWSLAFGVGPINGDFELVEAGIAFAVFAFLPICHLRGGHACVDIFTKNLTPRYDRFLRMMTEFIFATVLVIIAYQLFLGMISKYGSGQTSFLLQFPIWWGYALSLIGAVVTAVVGVYIAAVRMTEFMTGTDVLPQDTGADQ
jgi:TRAP-type C4-dicarboxylate transport system permease small subunit